MAVYIVTYDLKHEVRRPPIVKFLKESFPTWARLSESSYAIETSLTASAVYARFKPYIDSDDQIYVINLTAPWDGFGPQSVNQWLNNKLRAQYPRAA